MDPSRDSRAGRRSALTIGARLRRRLRPPRRLRPTRAGWSFFAICFGVGFAAFNTGNNLLYLVFAQMLAFLVLSGVLSESALRGIRVHRRLPRELFAGAARPVVLEVSNQQRNVPAFAIVVEDRVVEAGEPPRAGGRVFALRIGAGRTEKRVYHLTPVARGRLHFQGFSVFTRFPFGLFSKSLELEAEGDALVYPAVEAVQVPAEFGSARASGERVVGDGGSGADVSGLREFASGDSARRVHWRASLRRGELLVRDVENEHEAEIEVRLRTAGTVAGSAFEQRVSWAASEIVAHLSARSLVSLRTDEAFVPADSGDAQRARLLSFLALVEAGDAAQGEAA